MVDSFGGSNDASGLASVVDSFGGSLEGSGEGSGGVGMRYSHMLAGVQYSLLGQSLSDVHFW
jgi:hypothetical protein